MAQQHQHPPVTPEVRPAPRHKDLGGFITVFDRLRPLSVAVRTPFELWRASRPPCPSVLHRPRLALPRPLRRHRAVRQRRHRRPCGTARRVAGDDAGGDDPAPPASPHVSAGARP